MCHSRQGCGWSCVTCSLKSPWPGPQPAWVPAGRASATSWSQREPRFLTYHYRFSLVTSNQICGVTLILIMNTLSQSHPIKKQTPKRSWVMSSFILYAQSFAKSACFFLSIPSLRTPESWHPNSPYESLVPMTETVDFTGCQLSQNTTFSAKILNVALFPQT